LLDTRGTGHIGLQNVDKRAKNYGDEHCGLFIQSEPGRGTDVTLILKLMRREEKEPC